MLRKKHRLWQRWKEHSDDNLELKYKKQANKAAKAVRLAKRDFERKVAKNIKTDSKSFFSYVRSKTRIKSAVGPLTDDNDKGKLINDDPVSYTHLTLPTIYSV